MDFKFESCGNLERTEALTQDGVVPLAFWSWKYKTGTFNRRKRKYNGLSPSGRIRNDSDQTAGRGFLILGRNHRKMIRRVSMENPSTFDGAVAHDEVHDMDEEPED